MTIEEQPNEINFGDLILVDGYGDEPYYVDGWTIETHHTPDMVWTETWYDITSAHTGEYLTAELSDVTRICGEEQAEEYLANNVQPTPTRFGVTPQSNSRNPELERQRAEAAKKAEIDRLLAELGNYMTLYSLAKDEDYADKMEQVKSKLTEVVEEV